ncbi:helix-turn-helix domain-containing protein [Halobium salinum]|uniref:Helix-turn-helix domain-containing protein n=1 Tax=Halobium salinum TaxID=1364940 RepID=A0ABD5PA60_9EURY|nr:helix-turn-helix domain-containing protein [Halobium salinum]
MAVVVDMSVPPDVLGPARVLGEEARVEFDRVVPNGETGVAPYVWVESDDFGALEACLRGAPSVERFDRLEGGRGERLYSVKWRRVEPDAPDIFTCLALVDAAAMWVRGEGGSWTFRVRFPDESSVSTFAAHCAEHGVTMEPLRISRNGHRKRAAVDLTDEQREALVAAVRRGYFEVPRRATLSDLADELAVSDHAVSERLRRGLGRLVAQVVTADGVGGD